MAIRTLEELNTSLSALLGDNNASDEALSFMEDLNDSMNRNTSEDWEQKYRDNDKMWRDRYRDRFMGAKADEIQMEEQPKAPKRFEDLFSEVKK